MSRADLHLLSRHSNQPSEWVLRKLGIPESYTRPADIYERLRARGFDWVTITDQNTLGGVLEIADRPGVFLSVKVTAHFPEDGCRVHLLVWNLSEAQHREIGQLRKNIYELSAYLRGQGLAHGVAHPLRDINQRLTTRHVERMVLLFRIFEGRDASGSPLAQEVLRRCLEGLTPGRLAEMADRQRLEPAWPECWRKSIFGGSGDQAGLYLGEAWTECDNAASPGEFFRELAEGRARVGGRAGDVARVSNAIYRTIISYASDRMGRKAPNAAKLMGRVAERFLAGKNPTHMGLAERLEHVAEAVRAGRAVEMFKPVEGSLNAEITRYFLDPRVQRELDAVIAAESTVERRTLRMASKIANDLLYRLFLLGLNQIHRGNFIDSLQPFSGMLPIAAGVAPYVFSYHALHSNRPLVESTARAFLDELPPELQNRRRGWFTDTLEDVNGVARTIRTMARAAVRAGRDLTVVTCASGSDGEGMQLKNFPPVGEFELPEYKLQKISFPPLLDMIDYIERQGFTECIVSTPGPVGITAMAAAKLLGLRLTGIYHTDFPQYIRILTEDDGLESMAWAYMHWFYSQFDLVYVNSEFYRNCWVQRGIPPERLEILPRGLDTELFDYRRRDTEFWRRRGARHPVVLYVGRVSKEKELPFLAGVCRRLLEGGVELDFAFVGDGPLLAELQEILPEGIYTGVLSGGELGAAYASADLFVFPSTTDTFGNVVIEAMACGLPVLVSDVGGPCELIRAEAPGKILPANDLEAWTAAIKAWRYQPWPRVLCEAEARRIQQERSWDRAFELFWARTDNSIKATKRG